MATITKQQQIQQKHSKLINPPRKAFSSIIILHIFLLLILLLTQQHVTATTSNYDPYNILNVPKDAAQETIRKSYKKLCLKYHPDKNIHLSSEKERSKSEEMFKLIQKAHSDIGDEESRRKYDDMEVLKQRYGDTAARAYSSGGEGRGAGRSMEEEAEAFFQSFFGDAYGRRNSPFRSDSFFGGGGGRSMPRRRTRFYVNGVDISSFFSGQGQQQYNMGRGRSGMNSPFFNTYGTNLSRQENSKNQPKSIYIQKVSIPLADLYTGKTTQQFQLKETLFTRYKAGIRGGILKPLFLRGILSSLSTILFLQTKPIVSALFFFIYVHMNLPKPSQLFYESKLESGWKDGTKLTFQNVNVGDDAFVPFANMGNGGLVDVMFILKEEKHERFTRLGDDLKTTVSIGKNKAKKGCTLFIDPLSNVEMPVMIKLKPGEAFRKIKQERKENPNKTKKDDGCGVFTIRVKGRGWPKRNSRSRRHHGSYNAMEKGDLIVEVKVVSNEEATKLKRKKKKRKSSSSR